MAYADAQVASRMENYVTLTMNATLVTSTYRNRTCQDEQLDGISLQMCQIDYIGHGIVILMISAVGICMNGLNLVILRSPALAESCYVYLSGLALADLLSLMFFGVNSVGRGHFPERYTWVMYEIYVYFPLCSISTVISVFLTVTVSVERFIYIYKPHRAKVWCQPWRARRVTGVIALLAVIVCVPRFFALEMGENGALSYTGFGRSIYYKVLTWAYFIFISLGGCLVLLVLNILLIRGIHQSNARRRSLTGRKAHKAHEERRLTLTLISIIFVFIVGELPSSFVSRLLLVPMAGQEILATVGYKIAVVVATALVVLQHSLNFVMYCVFNKRFWGVFKQNLCSCLYNKIDKKSTTSHAGVMEVTNTGDSGHMTHIHNNYVIQLKPINGNLGNSHHGDNHRGNGHLGNGSNGSSNLTLVSHRLSDITASANTINSV